MSDQPSDLEAGFETWMSALSAAFPGIGFERRPPTAATPYGGIWSNTRLIAYPTTAPDLHFKNASGFHTTIMGVDIRWGWVSRTGSYTPVAGEPTPHVMDELREYGGWRFLQPPHRESEPAPAPKTPQGAVATPPSTNVVLDYTNWKGDRRLRRVRPGQLWFGLSEWHGDRQHWFLRAIDIETMQVRDFLLSNIHSMAEE